MFISKIKAEVLIMTFREGVVISAYIGGLCELFRFVHEYIKEILGGELFRY